MNASGFNLLTLFTFFYAIFWASTLEFNAKYRPFDPIGFFSKKPEAKKIRYRFLISLIFIDFIPVVYFALIFCLFAQFININQITWWTLILTGLTSLSVFGFTRLYPAMVATHKTAHYFYSQEEVKKIEISHHENAFVAYFVSSLIYLIFPLLTIFLMHSFK